MKERFMIACYSGWCDITRKDLKHVLTLKTDLEIEAFMHDCTANDVKHWIAWCTDDTKDEYYHQCHAITKKGNQCKQYWRDSFIYQNSLEEYLDFIKKHGHEPYGYCKIHDKNSKKRKLNKGKKAQPLPEDECFPIEE